MAKKSKTRQESPELASDSEHAALYEVLKGAKPVPLKSGRMVGPGGKFRPADILCYPQQMDSILNEDPARVKAVPK